MWLRDGRVQMPSHAPWHLLPELLPVQTQMLCLPAMQSHMCTIRAGAGCCPLTHHAAGPGSQSLQCEPQGSSFVTGFSQAVRVASTLNAFYPIGNVDCCTPSVLLSSGKQAIVVASSQHPGCQTAVQLLPTPILMSQVGNQPLAISSACVGSFQTPTGSIAEQFAEFVIVTASGTNCWPKCHAIQCNASTL